MGSFFFLLFFSDGFIVNADLVRLDQGNKW